MASGGYRKPAHPAPVSGPGALSQRTDGNAASKQPVRPVTGLPYGAGQDLQRTQAAAPMSASPGGNAPAAGALGGGGAGAPPQRTPFGAPSTQPGVPVTDGAAGGPGAGPEALGIPNQASQDQQELLRYLPVYQHMANVPGSPAAARNLVRSLMAFAVQGGGQ